MAGITVLFFLIGFMAVMNPRQTAAADASVLLEWFCPVRGWEMESDLWHNPRKYIVAAVMLLLAAVVGTFPMTAFVLLILLVVEIAVWLMQCRRC